MRKYAMIPICFKEDENRNLIVRRVLISYRYKTHKKVLNTTMAVYHGTKIIAKDAYFLNERASHKYTFSNRYYVLKEVNNDNAFLSSWKGLVFTKRRYHGFDKPYSNCTGVYPTVIEFKARNNQEATDTFNTREELK